MTSGKILQFITHGATAEATVAQVAAVLAGGCRWIQLRMKHFADYDIERVIERVKPLCGEYGAVCIMNDRVDLVAKYHLNGVHIGPEDMPVAEARQILGDDAIIGVTANTFDQILELSQQPVSYFGLGPMRFTTTKERLRPVIGLDGYHTLMQSMVQTGIDKPAVAVGGITLSDVHNLLATGLWGVAVSGAIAGAPDMTAATKQFMKQIQQHQ